MDLKKLGKDLGFGLSDEEKLKKLKTQTKIAKAKAELEKQKAKIKKEKNKMKKERKEWYIGGEKV